MKTPALPGRRRGSGVFSFIHVDDAADATVAAVERGAPGIYNVVDDEPAPRGANGCRSTRRRSGRSGRAGCRASWRGSLAGSYAVSWRPSCAARRTSARRRELGWQPRYASWRQGFSDVAGLAAGQGTISMRHEAIAGVVMRESRRLAWPRASARTARPGRAPRPLCRASWLSMRSRLLDAPDRCAWDEVLHRRRARIRALELLVLICALAVNG